MHLKNQFFLYLSFLFLTFTCHGTVEEGIDYFFISSLPFLPVSQTLRYQPGKYCRELTSAHSLQPGSSREAMVSEHKPLTTKPGDLEFNLALGQLTPTKSAPGKFAPSP